MRPTTETNEARRPETNDPTRGYIRAARRGRGVSRRTAISLLAGLLVVGITVGFAAAMVYSGSGTVVNQQNPVTYTGNGVTETDLPTAPPLSAVAVPQWNSANVASCTSSAVAVPGSSLTNGAAAVFLSGTTGGTACATGDFSELWTFTTAATLTAATISVSIVTTWSGASGTQTNAATLTVAAGAAGTNPTVYLYVDYGPSAPTSITTLTVTLA